MLHDIPGPRHQAGLGREMTKILLEIVPIERDDRDVPAATFEPIYEILVPDDHAGETFGLVDWCVDAVRVGGGRVEVLAEEMPRPEVRGHDSAGTEHIRRHAQHSEHPMHTVLIQALDSAGEVGIDLVKGAHAVFEHGYLIDRCALARLLDGVKKIV